MTDPGRCAGAGTAHRGRSGRRPVCASREAWEAAGLRIEGAREARPVCASTEARDAAGLRIEGAREARPVCASWKPAPRRRRGEQPGVVRSHYARLNQPQPARAPIRAPRSHARLAQRGTPPRGLPTAPPYKQGFRARFHGPHNSPSVQAGLPSSPTAPPYSGASELTHRPSVQRGFRAHFTVRTRPSVQAGLPSSLHGPHPPLRTTGFSRSRHGQHPDTRAKHH